MKSKTVVYVHCVIIFAIDCDRLSYLSPPLPLYLCSSESAPGTCSNSLPYPNKYVLLQLLHTVPAGESIVDAHIADAHATAAAAIHERTVNAHHARTAVMVLIVMLMVLLLWMLHMDVVVVVLVVH